MKKLMTSRNLITRILCFLLIFTLLSGSFAFGETNDDLIIEDEITEDAEGTEPEEDEPEEEPVEDPTEGQLIRPKSPQKNLRRNPLRFPPRSRPWSPLQSRCSLLIRLRL